MVVNGLNHCQDRFSDRHRNVPGPLRGFDARTGKGLVRGAGERHRAGWDITFSTPKTFGILWAAGTPQQRAVLERIQQEAIDQALQFMVSERLVEVRLGAGGRLRDVPADILVAKFSHFTSREGDPACHTHSVLLNLATHGTRVLTVEPKRTYGWQLVLGSWSGCKIWRLFFLLRRSEVRPANLASPRRSCSPEIAGNWRRCLLSSVRRQSVDWQRAASVVMAQGDSQAGLRTYAEHGSLDLIAGREAAQERVIEAWQEFRGSHGDDVLIVTRRNRDAVALNLIARDIMRQDGLVRGDDLKVRAVDRDDVPGLLLLAIGDKLRFGETLRQHRIRNGPAGL
jgi:hypothetical protein